MAICEDRVYEWRDDDMPQQVATGALQVGVGKSMRYLLTHKGELAAWEEDPTQADRIMNDVISFHAGNSGLFVVREDHSLWHLKTSGTWGFGEDIDNETVLVTGDVLTASIGDSANYYVTTRGRLYVKGRAHRGQYGDGKLSSSSEFVHTASDVIQVSSHTGHALILKKNGETAIKQFRGVKYLKAPPVLLRVAATPLLFATMAACGPGEGTWDWSQN
jgi:alpha-tubulin suppressor-like RCC1 family protein